MYASDDWKPFMARMTRAIAAGEGPFRGMTPSALDGIFQELSPMIGRSPEVLRDLFFTSIHGYFERGPDEMNKTRLQLGPLRQEVIARLRSDALSPCQSYRPTAQDLTTAVEAQIGLYPNLVLVEKQTDSTQAFYRIGRTGGGPIEITLHTQINRPDTHTQDVMKSAGSGSGLNCMLRPLFGDFRDWTYHSAEDVQRWTADVMRYSAAAMEWWAAEDLN